MAAEAGRDSRWLRSPFTGKDSDEGVWNDIGKTAW